MVQQQTEEFSRHFSAHSASEHRNYGEGRKHELLVRTIGLPYYGSTNKSERCRVQVCILYMLYTLSTTPILQIFNLPNHMFGSEDAHRTRASSHMICVAGRDVGHIYWSAGDFRNKPYGNCAPQDVPPVSTRKRSIRQLPSTGRI
jgi:hypothetical protein